MRMNPQNLRLRCVPITVYIYSCIYSGERTLIDLVFRNRRGLKRTWRITTKMLQMTW
jgi:hypothetical protein